MIDNDETNGFLHFYSCPKCTEVIKCKTADNLDVLVRIHEFDHRQQERAKGSVTPNMALAKIEINGLTVEDIAFLDACGIKA